jgi:hypothetical protein
MTTVDPTFSKKQSQTSIIETAHGDHNPKHMSNCCSQLHVQSHENAADEDAAAIKVI